MTTAPRLLVLLLLLAGRLVAAVCDDPGVRVTEIRDGDAVRLAVDTTNCLDITLSLTAELQNMHASTPLPLTIETHGQKHVELVTFHTDNAAQPPHFSYHYQWRYGSSGGKPDGTIYELPYPAGALCVLIQGYGGKFSHKVGSPNHFADDWEMPAGSPVLAARGGTVVGVRQDSTAGGRSEQFSNCANYVIIRHTDGTYAEYLHLQVNGVLVHLGDTVQTGQQIALSGNTGFSSRPHLHFAVFRAVDGGRRETLPVEFHVRNGSVQTLEEGSNY